jgi:hypothetical protein
LIDVFLLDLFLRSVWSAGAGIDNAGNHFLAALTAEWRFFFATVFFPFAAVKTHPTFSVFHSISE